MKSTITRAELLDVAQRAIALTIEAVGYKVPIQVDEIMEVARTAPRVAADATWWNDDEGYGCLAGWILKERYDDDDDGFLNELGTTYLEALYDQFPGVALDAVLQVVDLQVVA